MVHVTAGLDPAGEQLPGAQRHLLRRADRVRDHRLDPGEVRHPADQPGDDGAAGGDPRAVRRARRGQGRRPQGRGRVQGADRRRPPRGRQDPRGGARAGRPDRRARPASRPRPRPPASSSTATRRSGPSASRPSPRCAPRSARWPSTSPAASSARASRTTSAAPAWSTGSWPTSSRCRPPRPPPAGRGPLMLRGASAEAQARADLSTRGLSGDAATLGEELFGVAGRAPRRGCGATDRHGRLDRGRRQGRPDGQRLRQRPGRRRRSTWSRTPSSVAGPRRATSPT